MKKIANTFLAIVLILCSLLTFTACEDLYYAFFPGETYERYEEGNWEIAYSERFNDAVVGTYYWSGDFNDMDIVIPDTYRGAPVTAWGGLVINGKGIIADIVFKKFGNQDSSYPIILLKKLNTKEEIDSCISNDVNVDDIDIVDLTFNLHFGPNLKEFEHGQEYEPLKYAWYYKNSEGRTVVYVLCFNVTVDEANPTYYSDELGRLFYKDTNKLVPYIIYHNRDDFPEGSLPTLSDSQTEPNQ